MSKRMLLAAVGFVSICAGRVQAQDDPADKLEALPDFKIEHVLRADPKVHGSWINLGRDNKGRLLLCGQRNQPVTRLTMQGGKIAKEEVLKLPISEIMGILYAFDSLYVNGFGKVDASPNAKSVFGLFRLKDSGNDQYDRVEFLREWNGGAGEHGAHAIALGPDQLLYIVAGNFVNVPQDILPSSPHRNYADDRILPRAEDGNGFGAGRKPPGGYIVRVDRDGKNAELVASGQRNDYDIAFNADGELFGWDSDMEWDWGMPWYRPIRVFHATSGADQGFREGSAKWPDYYADSLPAVTNIGVGCPVGVTFGYGAKFPAKYQKALYILDWTYGRLSAVHLTPKGSTYTATWENLVAPKGLKGGPKTPLNLTDAVIGEDGALYFTVGGRNTQASLYRVSYVGSESTAPVDAHDKEGAEARAARHALEALHGSDDTAALPLIRDGLKSPDRFTRYAARIALERRPVESWKAHAPDHTTGLLALARVGSKADQADVFKGLPAAKGELLDKLRVIQVSISRHGLPAEDVVKSLAAEYGPLYPSKNPVENIELCQVLLALDAPGAVAKTVELLQAATTLEEQVGFVHHLRTISKGWTPELRKAYFGWFAKDRNKAVHSDEVLKWFSDAGRGYSDGASMPKFIGNFHTQAKATLTPEESLALADVLAAYVPPGQKPRTPAKKRPFVKEWKAEDLLPSLDEVAKDRNFERGKEVYESAQCIACHKFGSDGGSVGAELTAVSSRFARKDILESIIDPSKVISEQYANTMIMLTSGKIVDGRVLEENAQRLVLQPNPLQPDKLEIKKSDIDKRALSKVSPMPAKLVDTFTKDEILDLLAYLESGGRKSHPAFATLLRAVDVTDKLAAEVKENRLKITASNEAFGDPAPNMLKKLRVDYLEGDAARSKVVDENGTLEIRASDGKKLTIKKALYGVLP